MEIVQATKNDLSELCIFYEKVCEQQKFDKYSPDWHWGQYPCRDDLEYAIANRLFLLGRIDGKIAAAGILSDGDDDAYNHADWKETKDVCVLHLFAVSPEFRGKGIASLMLSAIKSSAKKAIHLDVIEGNDYAGKLYRKNGFALVKQTELFYDDIGEKGAELYEWVSPKKAVETNRLYLRRLNEHDAMRIYETWANDPEVTRYLTWDAHESVDVTKKIIAEWMRAYEDEKCHRYGICLKETDGLIGMIDVVDHEDDVPVIGYVLGRRYWGKGYMTEAFKGFSDYLLEEGFPEIRIEAEEQNLASNRVIMKCGFDFVGKKTMPVKGRDVIINKYRKKA